MDRLTKYDNFLKTFVVGISGISQETYSDDNGYVHFGDAIDRLAEYENLGLAPDELLEMKELMLKDYAITK